MKKLKVLAFGAHPDDIEIGAGGTLIKHIDSGDLVKGYIAIIPDIIEQRIEEARKASEILGFEIKALEFTPENIGFNRFTVAIFDKIIKEENPDIIYTHWDNDSHQDHFAVSHSTIAAARKNTCSVYMYEQTIPGGITPHAFRAQKYVNITDQINRKLDSLKEHKSQLIKNRDWLDYGITGRAMYRGYQCNVKYAEVFEVVKILDI